MLGTPVCGNDYRAGRYPFDGWWVRRSGEDNDDFWHEGIVIAGQQMDEAIGLLPAVRREDGRSPWQIPRRSPVEPNCSAIGMH